MTMETSVLLPGLLAACVLLAGPTAPARSAAARDLESEVEWVPADLHLGLIYLQGTVNGVATELVLDSGAAMTVIGEGLARRLELDPAGDVVAKGAGGTQSAHFVRDVEIACGSLRLALSRVVCIDLAEVNASFGRELPLILGAEAFQRYVVDIDYPNGRVAFRPREFVYEGPGHTLPLVREVEGGLSVEAAVEGLPPARFALDTGARGLSLFGAYTQENSLLEGRTPLSERQSTGVGATFPSQVGTLRTFTLAGYRMQDVPCAFTRRDTGAFASKSRAGNLGASVLSRFRAIVDVSRDRMHLEPAQDWEARPFPRDRLGLAARFRGDALEVTFVSPGSPAERAGWTPGQRIRALQGEPVEAATWARAFVRCAEAPVGSRIAILDGEGHERELVAADYY